VESTIIEVSKQRYPVRVVCANSVGIIDAYDILRVIRYQNHVGTLGKTFLHAVAMTIGRSFSSTGGTRNVSIDRLIGC
jgi:hypothetical protein